MALTEIQRAVCRLLAQRRVASGESYVAGGVALNEWLRSPRYSRDIDVFHDTDHALLQSWLADRATLEQSGFSVSVLREQVGFVQAEIARASATVRMEWVRESSYRFFPLVEHPELGLALHPFDLATNKLLALIGRREPRDWIDILECDAKLQPIGYLAWAACGKDPGFGPFAIVEEIARSARYSATELAALIFEGPQPDPAALSRQWHDAIATSRQLLPLLRGAKVGSCVLHRNGELCRLPPQDFTAALRHGDILFHEGTIRGAFPSLSSA